MSKNKRGRVIRWEDEYEGKFGKGVFDDNDTEVSWQAMRDASVEERVKPKVQRLQAKTKNQGIYLKMLETTSITLCVGPAGSGKTFMACGIAAQMLREGRIDKIVLSRPIVTCDEELGILPGDINEKVQAYVQPMMDAFGEFFTPKELKEHVERGNLEICPLAVMRGRTFKRAMVILDEAQNATFGQLRMFLTRFGEYSRVVVCGDVKQSDLTKGSKLPLLEVIDRLWGHDDIKTVYLTKDDILRHGLIRFVCDKLEE